MRVITALSYLGVFSPYVTTLLIFFSGALIGLALRKGSTAILLGVVGYAIASYVGLSFVPVFPSSALRSTGYSYIMAFNITHLSLTANLIAFAVGLVVGALLLNKL